MQDHHRDSLYRRIVHRPVAERALIQRELRQLTEQGSLAAALRALFRQQVNAGYVLFDPSDSTLEEKRFFDPELGITLRLQWNPQRELRKHHHLLIERGVLVRTADPERLINRNAKGVGCYLCHHNIAQQNPSEIALPIPLAGEPYYLGANFAPIADNHFTVMSATHRPQRYHAGILRAGLDLVQRSAGEFRAMFNGLAGASIEEHEHLQATDAVFPIEGLQGGPQDVFVEEDGARLSAPKYYLPVWLIEGDDVEALVRLGDRAIGAWQRLAPQRHTENLIISRHGSRYRIFVLLRDRQRLIAPGRFGAMASFEAGGLIVLSQSPEHGVLDERQLFDSADLTQMRGLLSAIKPERAPPEPG
jgi:hypothetical protein